MGSFFRPLLRTQPDPETGSLCKMPIRGIGFDLQKKASARFGFEL
jgi:hypothetical protein